VTDSATHGLLNPAAIEQVLPTTKGLLRSVTCSGANGEFWGYGGIGGQPIDGLVPDPLATSGYAIQLSAATGSGFGLQYAIGRTVMPARYRVNIRNRLSGPITSGGITFIATRNGRFEQALTVNLGTTYGRAAPDTLDLTAFVPGDVLNIEIYNNGTGVSAWVDYVSLVPIAD
jgi:hypothetical protein